MNKEQSKQPKKEKELSKSQVRKLFNSIKMQDTYTNQVDGGLANFILASKNPY